MSNIQIIADREGDGLAAAKGDSVVFESMAFLNHGHLVHEKQTMTTRIGARDVIAGIEHSLIGMKPGGYRKVKIGPHLAYRDPGVPGRIPANALLIYELWVQKVERPRASTHHQ